MGLSLNLAVKEQNERVQKCGRECNFFCRECKFAFTHSFMKVTSRHSFTLFRPFLLKKPLFRGENGFLKFPKNVQIMPLGMIANWEKANLHESQKKLHESSHL